MIDEKLLELLENKEKGIRMILDILSRSQKEYAGATKMLEVIDKGTNEETIKKFLKTTIKINQNQSKDITNLASLLLVYIQGSNFDSDVGRMLIKFGKGEDALRAMLKNKMRD